MERKKPTGDNGRSKRGRRPVDAITEPQRRAFEAIRNFKTHRGYPPTVQELANELKLATSSTQDLLRQLLRKGYLRREGRKARSLDILREPEEPTAEVVPIPIVGVVAGGQPILAVENITGELLVESGLLRGAKGFALKVKGDSMSGAGIFSGDYVVVRQQQAAQSGDIVVALLGDEATVKRLFISDERVELRPENPSHKVRTVGPDDDLRIAGKVLAVRRLKDRRN